MENFYNQIKNQLVSLSDEAYKSFNKKIIPTEQITLGVRLPMLRKIAKEIALTNMDEFLESDKENIYEMIMLEGLVLVYGKKTFIDLIYQLEKFLEKVDNWAEIDSVFCSFKSIKKQRESVLPVVKKWLKSENQFVVRAGLIILLAHYVVEEYLSMIFYLSQEVTNKGYYVKMGNGWLISVCMAKFPNQTINFLKENRLDKITHNKAIQKSRDSFRVSTDNKHLINTLKRK